MQLGIPLVYQSMALGEGVLWKRVSRIFIQFTFILCIPNQIISCICMYKSEYAMHLV